MFLLLALLLAWDGTGVLRISAACAVLHETGHLLLFRAWVGHWPRLRIAPGQVELQMRGILLPPKREFLLAAAGPAANFMACAAALGWMEYVAASYNGYWFAAANLLVGGANLLPLPGLDGARMGGILWRELQFLRR